MDPVKPLWSAENQVEFLLELTASTSDSRKELPLRRDVRSLGILLGRVLVEQFGQQLFNTVERLRRLLIQHLLGETVFHQRSVTGCRLRWRWNANRPRMRKPALTKLQPRTTDRDESSA